MLAVLPATMKSWTLPSHKSQVEVSCAFFSCNHQSHIIVDILQFFTFHTTDPRPTMKLYSAIASSILLATAQACVRVRVNSRVGTDGLHQEVYLWDNNMVVEKHMQWISGTDFQSGTGYFVSLNGFDSGKVHYPNGEPGKCKCSAP